MKSVVELNYNNKALKSFITKRNLFTFWLVINKKQVFNKSDFNSFKITKEVITSYTVDFWQNNETFEINGLTTGYIYDKIIRIERYNKGLFLILQREYIDLFPSIFSKEKFNKLQSIGECHFCASSFDKIMPLAAKNQKYDGILRSWKLDLSRLDSHQEYTPGNCVMVCTWCRNARINEFTEQEFLEIGRAVNRIWKNRLKENGLNSESSIPIQ